MGIPLEPCLVQNGISLIISKKETAVDPIVYGYTTVP